MRSEHDPDFVDWDAPMNAIYTSSPALTRLPDYDSFWRTLGGQGWSFGDEIERQRKIAWGLRCGAMPPKSAPTD